MKKSLAALGLLAVAALALSGCTDSAARRPSAERHRRRRTEEMTKIRVAALPIAETGALWAAIDEGIFADHGLEVEVVPAQGGAQAIPALLSGDIQFAIGQPFGPIRADLQDLGVVIIGNYASSCARRRRRQRGRRARRLRHHAARRSRRQEGLGQQPRRRRRPHDPQGRRGRRRRPLDDRVRRGRLPGRAGAARGRHDRRRLGARSVPRHGRGRRRRVGRRARTRRRSPASTVLTNITTQELIDEDPELVAAYSAAMAEALEWASGERGCRARGDRDEPRHPRGGGRRHHAAGLHVRARRGQHAQELGRPRRRVRRTSTRSPTSTTMIQQQ